MKTRQHSLSAVLALLLALALALSLPCYAADSAEGSVSGDTLTVNDAALSATDEEDEDILDGYDGEDGGDGISSQDNGTDSDGEENADSPYTLPVRSGDDITYELLDAVWDHSRIIIPQGNYTAGFLRFRNVSNVSIDGSGSTIRSTTKSDHGMGMYNCTNLSLSNLTLTNAGRHGIYVSDSSGSFTNVTVKDSYWSGMLATGEGTDLVVNDCLFQHNGLRPRSTVQYDDSLAAGFGIGRGAVVVSTDCTFCDNIASGVMITSKDGEPMATVTLYGALIANNGDHGIGACPLAKINMAKSEKRRCRVENNAHNGVGIVNRCLSDFVKDTDMIGNGQDGLSIGIDSHVTLVENCTMVNNKKHGMMVRRDSTLKKMTNCTMTGNKAYGILLNSESGTRKTTVNVVKTKLNKNTRDGLRIIGKGSSAVLKKCTLSGNKGSGIVVDSHGVLTELSNSKLTKNGRYGLDVYSKGVVNKASGNTFTGNKLKQVYARKGAVTKLKTK